MGKEVIKTIKSCVHFQEAEEEALRTKKPVTCAGVVGVPRGRISCGVVANPVQRAGWLARLRGASGEWEVVALHPERCACSKAKEIY
jgi:hypothetical protein